MGDTRANAAAAVSAAGAAPVAGTVAVVAAVAAWIAGDSAMDFSCLRFFFFLDDEDDLCEEARGGGVVGFDWPCAAAVIGVELDVAGWCNGGGW